MSSTRRANGGRVVRRSVLWVLLVVLVPVVGCGDDDTADAADATDADGGAADEAAGAGEDGEAVAACDLLTPTEVGAVVGGTPAGEPASSDGSACRWSGDGGSVDVVVVESAGATPADVEARAAAEPDAQTIAGVGDAAFASVASGKVGLVADGVFVVIDVSPTAGPATLEQLVQLGTAAGGRTKPTGEGPTATTGTSGTTTATEPPTTTAPTTAPTTAAPTTAGPEGDEFCALVGGTVQAPGAVTDPAAFETFLHSSIDLWDRAQPLAPEIAADLYALEEAYRGFDVALARYGYDLVAFATALDGDAEALAALDAFEAMIASGTVDRVAAYISARCGIDIDTGVLPTG
jgi:hypothetical protein